MCGRYALYGPVSRLRKQFDTEEFGDLTPRYNIAPQSNVLVIRQHPEKGRVGVMHKWGLVPSWAKDVSIGAKLNNARAETVAEKPAFRSAFKKLRCLIPANGFYEWKAPEEGTKAPKQPFYISPTEEEFFAFAGLVECWQPEGQDRLLTVCVITTEANELMAEIHDRMPAIIPKEAYGEWLDFRNRDVEGLKALLKPAPESSMQAWAVSRVVSRSSSEGEDLIRPLVED